MPATPKRGFKVCVCGGAGNLGQPLCMLAALDPLVWELCVYDRAISLLPAEGIACDLDHLERKCRVKAYSLASIDKEVDHLGTCLIGCDLVLACVGVPTQGKTKDSLIQYNGSMVKSIVEACARFCPNAVVGLIVNPVNAVVPAMATLYERSGLDPRKICGITGLDSVRANKFVHRETGASIEGLDIPVVGGHAGQVTSRSALPLFSQDPRAARIPEPRRSEIVSRIRDASAAVLEAKKGKGSATLSQAYAAWRFGHAVLLGLSGHAAEEYCFLKSDACEGLSFFASKVTFGPGGVERVHPVGGLSSVEQEEFDAVRRSLAQDIRLGMRYAGSVEMSRGT